MRLPVSIHENAEIELNEAAPIVKGGVRNKPLLKFPYMLIYSVRHQEIRLLAVAHQRRRPFYWRGRR